MSEYTDRFVPDGQYVISINDKPIVPPAADATFPARVEVGTAKDAAVLHIMGPEAQIQLTHNGQTLSLGRGQDDSEVDPKPLQWIMGEARSNSVWETPEEDLLIAFGGLLGEEGTEPIELNGIVVCPTDIREAKQEVSVEPSETYFDEN